MANIRTNLLKNTLSTSALTKVDKILIRITVFNKGSKISERLYDITEMTKGYQLIRYADCIAILKFLLGIDASKYPVIRPITLNPYPYYFTRESDGITLHVSDEDLIKMRDARLGELGI